MKPAISMYAKKEILVQTDEVLVNQKTGEVIPTITQYVKEDRDFNFTKVWLKLIIHSLDDISNQKTKLAYWIIDNLDRENKIVATQRVMAKKAQVSLSTVQATMRVLQQADFLRMINSGAYMINPAMLFKGKAGTRMALLLDYSNLRQPDEDNEDFLELED